MSQRLVSRAALSHLRAGARGLPGDGINALEARLGPRAPRVDLSLGIERRRSARALIPHLAEPAATLASRWASRDPALASVHALWFEYDLPTAGPRPSMPMVCAKVYDNHDARWLNDVLLPALVGAPLSDPQQRWVARAIDALPTGARVLYAFGLGSRHPAAIRLEFFGFESETVLPYLRRVAPDAHRPSIAAATAYLGKCDRLHLSLDFDHAVGPRIGLEGGFVRVPHREPRWRHLFDRLVADGLCTTAKRDAVLAWPGYDTRATLGRRWPHGAASAGYSVRSLSHVKLVVDGNRPLTAKAYLLFQYLAQRPRDRVQAAESVPAEASTLST